MIGLIGALISIVLWFVIIYAGLRIFSKLLHKCSPMGAYRWNRFINFLVRNISTLGKQ